MMRNHMSIVLVLAVAVCGGVSHGETIVQGAGDDYVAFTAGGTHAVITYEPVGTVDALITDNGDGTLTTVSRGDDGSGDDNDNGLVTYQIQFVDAPANYFLYFNFHKLTDDSVYVNHATGFNSVPGNSGDERWNSLDEGWNGLYEIGTGLGDNSNYAIPAGNPAYGWNVDAPSTVSFTVRNREDGVMWKDFVFSQRNDLSATELNLMIGIEPPPDLSVDFTYLQNDAATPGTGTIGGTVDFSSVGGPTSLEVSASMPAATITQKGTTAEPVPDGMVGFIASASGSNPGADAGVHLGWDGVVTLTGTDDGITYTADVPLVIPEDVLYYYQFVLTDDNSSAGGTNDAVGVDMRVAGWIGEDGDGHRHTGDALTWADLADTHTTAWDGNVDDNAWGDDLGITVGIRDDGPDMFPVFVDRVRFNGTLEIDPSTLTGRDLVAAIWDDVDGPWNLDTNWDPDTTPSADGWSAAVVDRVGRTCTVSTGGQSARSLAIANGLVDVALGGELTIGTHITVTGGEFRVSGGTLNATTVNTAALLDFQDGSSGTVGALNVTGGTATVAAPLMTIDTINASGGTLGLTANVTSLNVLDGGTVNTTAVVAADNVSVGDGGTLALGADLNINPSGSMTVGTTPVQAGANTVTMGQGSVLRLGSLRLAATAGFFEATGDISAAGGADTITLGGPASVLTISTEVFAGQSIGNDTNATFPGGGSLVTAGSTHTLTASGDDIWNDADGGYFAYQEFDGNEPFDVWGRVAASGFQGGTSGWRKAGLMARNSLDANSRNAFVLIAESDNNGIGGQIRVNDGDGSSGSTDDPVNTDADRVSRRVAHDTPAFLRLVYDGDGVGFNYYYSDAADPDPDLSPGGDWTWLNDPGWNPHFN